MKFNQLSLNVSQTINLGNYNSTKIEAGVVIDVEDTDIRVAFDKAKEELEYQMLDLLKEVKKGK